jgi:hypothetical protein
MTRHPEAAAWPQWTPGSTTVVATPEVPAVPSLRQRPSAMTGGDSFMVTAIVLLLGEAASWRQHMRLRSVTGFRTGEASSLKSTWSRQSSPPFCLAFRSPVAGHERPQPVCRNDAAPNGLTPATPFASARSVLAIREARYGPGQVRTDYRARSHLDRWTDQAPQAGQRPVRRAARSRRARWSPR